jgi:50S ribosomal subunit-associated GTPase HflX
VNLTILGNLEARHIPVIIAANKTDLKRADVKRISKAFSTYPVVAISAKNGERVDKLYEAVAEAMA